MAGTPQYEGFRPIGGQTAAPPKPPTGYRPVPGQASAPTRPAGGTITLAGLQKLLAGSNTAVDAVTDPAMMASLMQDRLNALHPPLVTSNPSTALQIAASPHVPTDRVQFASWAAYHVLNYVKPSALINQRWEMLPAMYRDAYMVGEYGKDWHIQGHTWAEGLAHLNSLPEGYGSMLLGNVVKLPSTINDAAQSGDPAARSYLQALFYLLPPHAEGSGSGYYYHWEKPGVVSHLFDPISITANTTLNGLWDLVTSPLSVAGQYAGYGIQRALHLPTAAQAPQQGTTPFSQQQWNRLPSPLDLFSKAAQPTTPGTGAGAALLRFSGMDPTNPKNAEALGIATLFTQFVGLNEVGALSRGFKLINTSVNGYSDLKAAEQAAVAAGDFQTALDAQQRAASLLNSMSRSTTTRAVYNLFSKSPEQLLVSGRGARVVDYITQRLEQGATAADLSGEIRLMPMATADALTTARNRADVVEILAGRLRGETQAALEPVTKRLGQIDAQMQQSQWLASGRAQMPPHIQAIADTTGFVPSPLTVDETNALMSERSVLKARQSAAISTTLEAPQQLGAVLPSTSPIYRAARDASRTVMNTDLLNTVLRAHVPLPSFARVTYEDATIASRAEQTLIETQADLRVQALATEGIKPTGNLEAAVAAAKDQMGSRGLALADRADRMQAQIAEANSQAALLEGKTGERLLRWRPTSPTLGRFWDDIHGRTIWDTSNPGPHVPADAVEQNITNVRRILTRLDVNAEVRNRVIGLFSKTGSDGSKMFEAMRELGYAIESSPLIDAREAGHLSTFIQRLEQDREVSSVMLTKDLANGMRDVVTEPTNYTIGADGLKTWTPSGPEEMIGGFPLPNYEALKEATSTWRRILHSVGVRMNTPLGEGGTAIAGAPGLKYDIVNIMGRPTRIPVDFNLPGMRWTAQKLAQTYKVGAHFKTGATRAFKTFVIIPRSIPLWFGKAGAFQFRTIGEQNLGMLVADLPNYFTEPADMARLANNFDQTIALTGDDPYKLVGSMASSIRPQYLKSQASIFRFSHIRGVPDPGSWEALSEFAAMRRASIDGRLFGRGATLEDVQSYMASKAGDAVSWREQMAGPIEQHRLAMEYEQGGAVTTEQSMNDILARRYQEMDQKFGSHPEVRASLATGQLVRKVSVDTVAADVQRLRDKVTTMEANYQRLQHQALESTTTGSKFAGMDHISADTAFQELQATRNLLAGTLDAPTGIEGTAAVGTPEYGDSLAQLYHADLFRPQGEVSGTMRMPQRGARQAMGQFVDRTYENWIAKKDIQYARGPAFEGLAARERARLESLGWRGQALDVRARINSARDVKQIMFDLGSRTAAENFFGNITPFGAAWENIMRRWTWRLPKLYYPGVGQAYLLKRAQLFGQFMAMSGFHAGLQEIPFFHRLTEFIHGIPVIGGLTGFLANVTASLDPSHVSLATGGFGPGLGPIDQAALAWAGRHNHYLAALDAKLTPYGPEPTFGPANVTRLWEGWFGQPPPWVQLWGPAQEYQWNSAIDTATAEQYKYGLDRNGKKFHDTKPIEAKYPQTTAGTAKYNADYTAWIQRLEGAGKASAQKYALVMGVLSTVSPTNIFITDPVYSQYQKLRTAIGNFPPGDPRRNEAFAAMERLYPYSQLYGASRTQLVTPPAIIKAQAQDSQSYRAFLEEIASGKRLVLPTGAATANTPIDFVRNGLYLQSRHFYEAQRAQVLRDMAGTQGAAGVLRNWYQYRQQLGDLSRSWDSYTAFHQAEDGYYHAYLATLPNDAAHPNISIAQEQLFGLLGKVNDALPYLTEGGVKPQALSSFKTLVDKALVSINAQYGVPTDPTVKALDNWFQNVAGPYWSKTQAIYNQIDATPRENRGPLYAKLQALTDSQKAVGNFPTPEQFQWYAKSPAEQQLALAKWATNKLEWTTTFQREQLGFPTDPASSAFITLVTQTQDTVRQQSALISGTGSTAAKQNLANQANAYLTQQAQKMGQTKVWNLISRDPLGGQTGAAPFQRLLASGFGANDPQLAQLAQVVKQDWAIIVNHGDSPNGSAAFAESIKQQLYAQIDAARKRDPNGQFAKDMSQLEVALAPAGSNSRPGADMYAPVFFNQWPFTINLPSTTVATPSAGSYTGPRRTGGLSTAQLTSAAQRAGVPVSWFQQPGLWNIIGAESGGNPTAQNATSSAFGIFQFLDSTWAGTGIAKTSDPFLQWVAGLKYIKARYGSPNAAWAYHQTHNSY